MSLYHRLAQYLQYISPSFYKKRFFKQAIGLTASNVMQRKVEPELLWIKDFLQADDVYIDVGANVGTYLYCLENRVKPQNTYAFEPNMALARRLKRIFEGIHVSPIALSAQNGRADFKIPVLDGQAVASRGTLNVDFQEADEQKQQLNKVQTMRFDDWVSLEKLSKINLIKIDVEGHEMACIQGMLQSIAHYQPVLMVEMEQRHHQNPLAQHIGFIEQLGYQAHYFCREDLVLKPLDKHLFQQDASQLKQYAKYINNFVFLPTKA
jgi:FkbM family methyltransferase